MGGELGGEHTRVLEHQRGGADGAEPGTTTGSRLDGSQHADVLAQSPNGGPSREEDQVEGLGVHFIEGPLSP
jgi:hypothetical protein